MENKQTGHYAIFALFFLSGAVGLAYEVIWARQLSLLLGVSIYAVSAVLVAFMGGLGAGAEYFGQKLDKGLAPIRLYAILEIGVGIYVFLFPLFLSIVEALYISLHGGGESASLYVISLRFFLAVGVLLVPAFLMGGTLPAIVRYFSTTRETSSSDLAGTLYGINTLGAMTGCVIAGFLMIEYFGLTNSLRIGAMLNLTIGAVAWVLAGEKSFYIKRSKQNRKKEKTEEKQKLDVTLLLLYGVSGFCALSLQVLWTRTLILLLNNTTYAFSMILAVFLLGIGTGSILASRWLKNKEGKGAILFAFCQIGVGVMALVSLVGMGMNDMVIAQIASLTDTEGWMSALIPGGEPMVTAILFSFLIVTPCTFLMGAGFPMIVEAISPNREKIGGAVGRLYAFNIAGCVTGSVLAAYALIPVVGVQNSILAIAWISVISGAFILLTKAGDKKVAPLSGAFVVLAVLTLYVSIGENIAYSLSAQKLDEGSEIEFYEEGTSATVLVSSQVTDQSVGRRPIKRIWIDGDPIAGAFREALQLERLQAHIPLLFHKNPKNALVICFGTGSTAGAALAHGLESVTAVDISKEVFHAAPYFSEGNLGVASSPRLTTVEEDGRNYLLTTNKKFDFITSEPPPPSNAGIISLYTTQFYETAKEKLAEEGVISQWIPLHHLSESDFKSLVASFTHVFPGATMWYTKWDAIMIGSKDELLLDLGVAKRRMADPEIARSLSGIGVTNVFQLSSNYMMGPSELREFVDGVEPLSDDMPTVEFTAPRIHSKGVVIKGANLTAILKHRAPPKISFDEETKNTFDEYFSSQTIFFHGKVAENDGNNAVAARLFSRALEINDDNADARYAYLSLNIKTLYEAYNTAPADIGLKMLDHTEKLDREGLFGPQLKFLRGMFLVKAEKYLLAEKEFIKAVAKDGDYFLAIVNLAGLYMERLDRRDEAKRLYKRALELKPSEMERKALVQVITRL